MMVAPRSKRYDRTRATTTPARSRPIPPVLSVRGRLTRILAADFRESRTCTTSSASQIPRAPLFRARKRPTAGQQGSREEVAEVKEHSIG